MRDLTKLPDVVMRVEYAEDQGPEYDPTCMGSFLLESFSGGTLRIIVGCGYGWEHVSVSLVTRVPNYNDMKRVKRIFFEDTECVMELHVPTADHINAHPYCLHLWRPTHKEIPRPPAWMVGGMSMDEATELMRQHDPVTGEPLVRDHRPPGWATSDAPCYMCGHPKKDHLPWQDEARECAEPGYWDA